MQSIILLMLQNFLNPLHYSHLQCYPLFLQNQQSLHYIVYTICKNQVTPSLFSVNIPT